MLRSNRNTIEGERAGTVSQLFFSDGLFEKGMEAGRDVFFGEKYMELPHRAGSGCLPRRRFDARTANSNRASFWSSRSTSSTSSVIWRTAFDVGIFLHKNKVLRFGQRCCPRPGASSDETGTMMMGKFYYSDAFFSYPVIMYFTAGFAGVFSAPHHMWKPWCKQKKSVGSWFWCRERPAWLGSSREGWQTLTRW